MLPVFVGFLPRREAQSIMQDYVPPRRFLPPVWGVFVGVPVEVPTP